MANQQALDRAYMRAAYGYARDLSHARRKKVGAVLVAPDGGGQIAEGINGKPTGFSNCCEDAYESHRIEKHLSSVANEYTHYECARCQQQWPLHRNSDYRSPGDRGELYVGACLVTQRECLHAETNAIAKVACSTQSTIGATMYTTLSPCFDCAKLMIQCRITRVVCAEVYRIPDGIDLLRKAGIQVDIWPLEGHNVMNEELNLQDEGRQHDDEKPWRNT